MSAAALPMLRASALKECPRMAIYQATGAPHRELSAREEKTLFRGRRVGQDWVVMFAATNETTIWVDSGPHHWVPENLRATDRDSAGVIAELIVHWGDANTGHADAYVRETGSIIEVLSSQNASADMLHSKLVQVTLYIEHTDATGGAVVVVNPVNLEDEVFPVAKTSATYQGLVVEMRARVNSVQRWTTTRELPQRVCGKPADARSHFCQYADHCFTGWEPPELTEVVASSETKEAVEQLRNIKQERRVIGQRDAQLKKQQDAAQALLGELPIGQVQVGRFQVKRVHVQRKPAFQWEKAELAGVFEPGLYDQFFKPGAAYDTWDVEAVEPETDFGDEVPF